MSLSVSVMVKLQTSKFDKYCSIKKIVCLAGREEGIGTGWLNGRLLSKNLKCLSHTAPLSISDTAIDANAENFRHNV